MTTHLTSKQHRTMFSLLMAVGVLMACIGLFSGHSYAWTYSNSTTLNNRWPSGLTRAYNFDNVCQNNLTYDHFTIGPYPPTTRNMINGVGSYHPVAYQQDNWISGTSPSQTSVPVPYNNGTSPISLKLNAMTFLCFTMVQLPGPTINYTNGTNDNTALKVQSANTEDYPPNPVPGADTVYGPALTDRILYYKGASATLSSVSGCNFLPGTINLPTSATDTPRDSNSRYWFNSPVGFNFTPSSAPSPGTSYCDVVNLPSQVLWAYYGSNGLQGAVVYCVNNSGQTIQLVNTGNATTINYSQCATYNLQILITFDTLPAPPLPNFTNVSGRVYQITNSGAPAGIAGEKITSCLESEPAYNPAGKGIIGVAWDHTGNGYWLAAPDGGVFTFGDAPFYGSKGGQPLNKPIVAFEPTPSGLGYILVAGDGGVFRFGDANTTYFWSGSLAGQALNKPIVGFDLTPSGKGAWLVGADGGVFTFGDAGFYGSTAGQALNKPVIGIRGTPDGGGYTLVAGDGGVFRFGNANTTYYWPGGAISGLAGPIVSFVLTPSGKGAWLLGSDGGIFTRGDAGFYGSFNSSGSLASPDGSAFTAIVPTADGGGYYGLQQDGYLNGSDPKRSSGDAFVFVTDSNGNYQFPVADSTGSTTFYYCVRVSPPPPGLSGPTLDSDYKCPYSTYEWQASNELDPTIHSGCSVTFDLSHDTGLNFVYQPPPISSCGSVQATVGIGPPAVGKNFALVISFTVSGATSGSPNVTITASPSINNWTNGNGGAAADQGGGNYVYATPKNLYVTNAGSYNISWTISGGGLAATSCPPQTIYLAYQPYFNVLGGNAVAGPGYNPSCSYNNAADIDTYNIGDNAIGPPWYGAGSQLAALVSGNLNGYPTSLNPDASSSLGGAFGPSNLAFANTTANGYDYGGNLAFARSWACLPDYYGNTSTSGVSYPGGGIPAGGGSVPNYYIANPTPGYLTISGGSVNGKVVIKVNGDVYITGPITYGAYSAAGVNALPGFQLVVKGNIYINQNVQELDGIYIAQGGTIYTCANDGGVAGGPLTRIKDYTTCNQPLLFRGAVSATTLDLDRTFGNPVSAAGGSVPNSPAESFQFSPEAWLQTSQTGSTPVYQYVTSLPPVL